MKTQFILYIAFLLTIVSCSNPESKLIGTWKVTDVETHFDENRMTPEMVLHVVEMQKETYFRILNDSVIIIVSSDNTHEGKWSYDKQDSMVSYYFDVSVNTKNNLGKFRDGDIISETEIPIGKMIITYGKEE